MRRGICAVTCRVTFATCNTSSDRRPPVLLIVMVNLLETAGTLISISRSPSEEGETWLRRNERYLEDLKMKVLSALVDRIGSDDAVVALGVFSLVAGALVVSSVLLLGIS